MKKLKRAVAALLTAAMMFSSMPVAAFAVTDDDLLDDSALDALIAGSEDDTDLDDDELDEETAEAAEVVQDGVIGTYGTTFWWDLYDGVLTVKLQESQEEAEIPAFSSAESSLWYKYKDEVTKIVIEDGITNIGSYTFSQFANLESVEIGNAVISIDEHAFSDCVSLTSIDLPLSIVAIEESAFSGCTALDTIKFAGDYPEFGDYCFEEVTATAYYPDYWTSAPSDDIGGGNITWTAYSTGSTEICTHENTIVLNAKEATETEEGYTGEIKCTDCGRIIAKGKTIPALGTEKSGTCGIDGDNLTWTFDNGLLTISGEGEMQNYSSDDPAPWSSYKITDVVINEGVTSIGSYCHITAPTVHLPDSVEYIADHAFGLVTLSSIDLPEGLISIGDGAFSGSSLTSIDLPDSLVSIGDKAFSDSSLTSIDFPDSVVSIGDHVFEGCASLTSVSFSDNLETIGDYTFNGCGSLASVDLPSNLTIIGYASFFGCKNLTSIVLPETVTSIGEYAFQNCENLSSINLPESITSIGMHAFDNCAGLTNIELPSGLTSIGDSIFYTCSNLRSIDLPDGITVISCFSFMNCTSLADVDLPASVTSIKEYAFYGCTSLTSIEIPSELTEIGYRVFYGCTNLTTITFTGECPTFGNDCFNGVTATAYYPSTWTDVPASDVGGGNITWVPYSQSSGTETSGMCGDNLKWSFKDGVLTISGTGEMYGWLSSYKTGGKNEAPWAEYADEITEIVVEEGATSIGACAFYFCTAVTNVSLPSSLTTINEYAFNNCQSLTHIDLPEGVTTIEMGAFGVTGLQSIELPESVTSIGTWLFSECTSLIDVKLPSGITSIGAGTFYHNTSLTTIKFAGSYPVLNNNCFNSVTATAYYPSTWADVPASDVGGGNITWVPYNTDGTVGPVNILLKTENTDQTDTSGNHIYKLTAVITPTDINIDPANTIVSLDLGDEITTDDETEQVLSTDDTAVTSATKWTLTWKLHVPTLNNDAKYTVKLSVNNDNFADGVTCLAQDTFSVPGIGAQDYDFVFGRDDYSFINSPYYFGSLGNSIYISDEDLAAYLENLEETEIKQTADWFASGSIADLLNNKLEEWGGSCYGMALTVGLLKIGALQVDDYETTYQIPALKASENSELESMINIYQISQASDVAIKGTEIKSGTDGFAEVAEKMWEMASNIGKEGSGQQPYAVVLRGSAGGHAVLCYGVVAESEEDTTHVLKVYDPNSREAEYITFSDDFTSASYSESDYGFDEFGYRYASLAELDAYNYTDVQANYSTKINIQEMNDCVISDGENITEIKDGEIIRDDIGIQVRVIDEAGNTSTPKMLLLIENGKSSYTITPTGGDTITATVYFDGIATSVNGTASSATFNSNGTVTVKDAEGDIEISAAINDGNLSFASVTGDANGDVTANFTANSLSVSGDIENAEASNFDVKGNSSEIELDETGKAYADANGKLSTSSSGSGTSSGGSGGGAGGGIAVVGAGAVLAGTAIAAKLKSDKATAALPDSSLIHVTENGNEKAFTTKVWSKKLTVSTEANTAVLTGSRSYIEQLSAQGIEQITLSAKTSDKILFVWPVTKKTTVNVSALLNSTPQNGTFQVVLE